MTLFRLQDDLNDDLDDDDDFEDEDDSPAEDGDDKEEEDDDEDLDEEDDVETWQVSEPSSILLLGSGLVVLHFMYVSTRRRRRAGSAI